MLKREIAHTFAGSVVSAALALGTQVVLARTLGPGPRGVLALALLIPTIMGVFCGLGQQSVNATFAGLHKDRRSTLFLQSLLMTLFSVPVSVLVLCGFYFWLPIPRGEFADVTPTMVWLTSAYTPAFILATMLVALVRGVGRTSTAAVLGTVQATATLALTAALVWWLRWGLHAALLIPTAAALLSAAISFYWLRDWATLRWKQLSWGFFRQSVAFGATASMANFATFLVYRIDQGILGYMVPADALGLYVVSVSLAERLRMLPDAIATAFLPRLANELSARQSQVPVVFRCTVLVSLGCLAGMAVAGIPAILLLFGREFTGSIIPFLVLLPGLAALGGDAVVSSALLALGKPKYAMWTSWLALAANVALNFALIPGLGITGAALASTLAYSVSALVMAYCYARESRTPFAALLPRRSDVLVLAGVLWALLRPYTPWRQRPAPS